MKKKCALLLAFVLTAGTLMPGIAFAAEESGGTEETTVSSEESSSESENGTAAGTEETAGTTDQDPREALSEAMETNGLDADAVIADGVWIDTVDVSGMTAEQALEAVLAYVDSLGSKVLTLTLEGADGVAPLQVPVSQLGLKTQGLAEVIMEAVTLGKSGSLIARYKAIKDLEVSSVNYELTLSVDEAAVSSFVSEQTSALAVEPVNAELTRTSSGFEVSQSQSGIAVDTAATTASIMSAMANWNKEDVTVTATAQVTQPERTTEMLSQIQDSLGSFSTETSSPTSGRMQNLRRGVELTTGVLIMPGESWSMHSALSPFSAENGYTQQVAYSNGGYVQEYGGGICQLATTLYNAALLSEINISKRSNHSMVVNYTDWGLDATINDSGSKDLELTNDFDFPVYIEASVTSGGTVTYTIWGKETRPANRTLKFYGVTIEQVESGTEETVDPSLAPGERVVDQSTSYPKVTAQAYKEIYVDGVLQEKILLHTDKYRASPAKVRVGPAAAETAAPTDTTAPSEPSSETAATDPAATAPSDTSQVPATDPTVPSSSDTQAAQ